MSRERSSAVAALRDLAQRVERRLHQRLVARLATAKRQRSRSDPSGKTVILHAGFRKTGTTTIQVMLEENRELLASHMGVITRRTQPSTDAIRIAGRDYAKDPGEATARRVRDAARELDDRVRKMPQPIILLSEENVIGHNITSPNGDLFDSAANVLSVIEEEFAGHDLRFVFTTRRARERWLRSCWNQDVKVHKFTGDYATWVASNGRCRPWDKGERLLREALRSPLSFRAMEDDLAMGRFLGLSLLELADMPGELIDRVRLPAPQNPSLRSSELEFMREINGLDLPFSITHRICEVVQKRRDLFCDRLPK